MRGEIFLEKFGLIDEKYIEEAEGRGALRASEAVIRSKKKYRSAVVIAACFLLALTVAVLPFLKNEEAPVPAITDETEDTADETGDTDIDYSEPVVYDGIPYSSLDLSDTGLEPSLSGLMGGSAMLAEFTEEDLVITTAVIEGRVVDVRPKHYDFITDYDKFGDGSRTRYLPNSVVYDIEVERVYKGDITVGEIFTVEVNVIAPRYSFYLKEDHSYVIPITVVNENWHNANGNIVEGSAERDSMYSILYQYHPPVERTEDGYYLFSDDWTTLAASENAYRVTMDIPFDEHKARYNDKMMIIDGVSFEELFERILTENS